MTDERPMRFGFVTCVQLGLSCMEAIYAAGGRLDLAITLEDDMAQGKSGRVWLDEFCGAREVELVKIRNINRIDAIEAIRAREIDWLFIIGWSQIARDEVLSAPKRGVIGMHPTLLPVGRGRAAIPWAILKGLDETGVTMFQLDAGVDTGPIIAQHKIPLRPDTTATDLYDEVDRVHVELMRDVFPKLRDGLLAPVPQDNSLATEWPGRKPDDGAIDLAGSAVEAERLVRAVTRPYPGAFVDVPGGRLVVWSARLAPASGGGLPGRDMRVPILPFADGALVATEWDWQD